jgi:hypothetical protein
LATSDCQIAAQSCAVIWHGGEVNCRQCEKDAAKEDSLLDRARQHTEQVLGEFLGPEHWQLNVKWGG